MSTLNAYEAQRAANIARNQQLLAALGLTQHDVARAASQRAAPAASSAAGGASAAIGANSAVAAAAASPQARKRRRSLGDADTGSSVPPTRRSTRSSTLALDAAAVEAAAAAAAASGRASCRFGAGCYRKNPQHKLDEAHPGDEDYVAVAPASPIHVAVARDAATDAAELASRQRRSVVDTASYQHTLMRVRTMSVRP